jgi:hypothetical protein
MEGGLRGHGSEGWRRGYEGVGVRNGGNEGVAAVHMLMHHACKLSLPNPRTHLCGLELCHCPQQLLHGGLRGEVVAAGACRPLLQHL